MGQLIQLNSGNFERKLRSKIPLAVDFYADWCAPCKDVDPIIDKLASEYRGKITFARLNVDENQEIADRFEVLSLPTLLIFSKGKAVKKFVGTGSIKGCKREIKQLLT
jgi:thioredoxin 1